MPKILRYLIKVSTLSSNIRFSASFQRLGESTHYVNHIIPHHLCCGLDSILLNHSYCIEHKTQALKVTNETLQTATSVQ